VVSTQSTTRYHMDIFFFFFFFYFFFSIKNYLLIKTNLSGLSAVAYRSRQGDQVVMLLSMKCLACSSPKQIEITLSQICAVVASPCNRFSNAKTP
jgi:hypothetical protein